MNKVSLLTSGHSVIDPGHQGHKVTRWGQTADFTTKVLDIPRTAHVTPGHIFVCGLNKRVKNIHYIIKVLPRFKYFLSTPAGVVWLNIIVNYQVSSRYLVRYPETVMALPSLNKLTSKNGSERWFSKTTNTKSRIYKFSINFVVVKLFKFWLKPLI